MIKNFRLTCRKPISGLCDSFRRNFTVTQKANAKSWDVMLNFQENAPGTRTGRYINTEDKGELTDVMTPQKVTMHNARLCEPKADLESNGFLLDKCPTKIIDFRDDAEIQMYYYDEIKQLLHKAIPEATRVTIFDHTVRMSSMKEKNTLGKKGAAASAVARVHCDYTTESAPKRVMQLSDQASYTSGKPLFKKDTVPQLMKKRFMLLNIWRSIDPEYPITQNPLAVCDAMTVDNKDRFLYELVYDDRIGLNYSLEHNLEQKWYYYPNMTQDECLVFKVFDSKEDGSRFTFHTAFDEPQEIENPTERMSIECRSIVFF